MTSATRRPRNAAATRQAILTSAVTAFTRHGYDGVGVRDIAADAGVTAMLVNRYFGSKEGLFTEVVDVSFAPPTMVPSTAGTVPSTAGMVPSTAGTVPSTAGMGSAAAEAVPSSAGSAVTDTDPTPGAGGGLAAEIAGSLVARTAQDAEHLGPFELMIKSAANPRAAEIIRAGIEKHVGARFTAALEGPDAPERAELGLALLAGTWLMRRLISTPALREADSDQLTDRLTRMLSVVVSPSDGGDRLGGRAE